MKDTFRTARTQPRGWHGTCSGDTACGPRVPLSRPFSGRLSFCRSASPLRPVLSHVRTLSRSYPLTALLALITAPALLAADRPDIVIILTDQQQAAAMSCSGNPGLSTPAMDGLAREGVRFTHAFCSTPQCSPARAAMWTGHYPHRTGVMGNVADRTPPPAGMSEPLRLETTTIGELFAAAGYETAYFGKWHLGRDPGQHGFQTHETRHARGPRLTENVQSFLKGRRPKEPRQPLLMIVSYINPHDIYLIAQENTQSARELPRPVLPPNLDDNLDHKPLPQKMFLELDQGGPFLGADKRVWREYLDFYYGLTEKVDADVGKVVQAVREWSPDSLIVFTSDHGDLAGAHGLPFKGPATYEELVRIPLIISWPGHMEPDVRDQLVSHVDLLPSLCEICGVKAPADLDGQSLVPLLRGRPKPDLPWREAVFAEYYGKQAWRVPIRMVRTPRHKYVRYLGYGEELYDLERDPAEMNNLARSDAHQELRAQMSARLDDWIKRTGDPFESLPITDRQGNPIKLDQATSTHSSP